MTDQRILQIKVLTSRKPVPGKIGGGIFSFQDGNRTEFGSFFFDCLFCEKVKVEPDSLKTKSQVQLSPSSAKLNRHLSSGELLLCQALGGPMLTTVTSLQLVGAVVGL